MKSFDKIVTNIGAQLRLPKEDIEGIKLSAMGGSSKRDYLAFDCAMKDKGEVRYFLFHHIFFLLSIVQASHRGLQCS